MQPQVDLNYIEIKDSTSGVTCMMCEKWFKNQTRLKCHMWEHTGVKPFPCLVCNRGFTQQGNLKAHLRMHTGEKPYVCTAPSCDAKFTQRSNLKAHIKIHTGEKPYKCGLCRSAFRQATNLRTHCAIHTGERPYKCEICSKTFTQKSNLKAHRDRVHRTIKKEPLATLGLDNGQDDIFYSNLNVMYTKNGCDTLEIHGQNEIIVETDHTVDYGIEPTVEILIPEEIMSKDEESFQFSSAKSDYDSMEIGIPYIKEEPDLNIEIVEGNIDEPYSCEICNNTYLSVGDLKIHQCIKGLRYFECDLCNDWMQTLADLKNHQASHSEGTKYCCSLCGLVFINRQSLRLHHKLHNKVNGPNSNLKATLVRAKPIGTCKSKSLSSPTTKRLNKQKKIKHLVKKAVSRSVWNLRHHTKKVATSQVKSRKKTQSRLKNIVLAQRKLDKLSRSELKTRLSQHYAVSYKHFLILQRQFVRKQSSKLQSESTFSVDSRSRFVPSHRSMQTLDKTPSVTISKKKDISPLFMCSECKSYFSSLGDIKRHMEMHRKMNTIQKEDLNKELNSQNVFVISECLQYDEPIAQISKNQ